MAQSVNVPQGISARVICVGVNPAFDITLRLTSLLGGEVSRAYAETSQAAGKALNVARSLARSGIGAGYLCLLGESNSGAYISELESMGISYQAVMCPGATRENLTLLVDGAPREYKINREGFRAGAEQAERLEELIRTSARDASAAVFSGSMPPGLDAGRYMRLMRAAKDAGARLAIDTEALSAAQLTALEPWLYKPNRTELCALLGMDSADGGTAPSEDTLINAARRLGEQGIENILLTLGERGLALVSGYGSRADRIYGSGKKLENTTGAGDRSLAGFTAAWLAGAGARECAERAAAFAEEIAG